MTTPIAMPERLTSRLRGLARGLSVALVSGFMLIGFLLTGAAQAATSPAQPASGPGGQDYLGTTVAKRVVGKGGAVTYAYHLALPATQPRPVVVLFHAWGAINPRVYGNWIEHLARKGSLVLVPRYQELNRTRGQDATERAVTALAEAFAQLAADPQAMPDRERVAFLGHLAGAGVAANVAGLAAARDLPVPRLVFAVTPGGLSSDPKSRGIPLSDVATIAPETMIVTLIGDRDHLPSDRAARRILRESIGVPVTRKLFMRMQSDDHGYPPLSATLIAAGSANDAYDASGMRLPPEPPLPRGTRPQGSSADARLSGEQMTLIAALQNSNTDTIDWLALWKTFDMARDAAFAGRDTVSLRDDPAFTDMGRWSNGWPLKRLSAEVPRDPSGAAAPAEAQRTLQAPRR
jgi:acetyl esterase/lipase